MKIYKRISVEIILIILFSNCQNITKNDQEKYYKLNTEEKGTIEINDSRNNRYLGIYILKI